MDRLVVASKTRLLLLKRERYVTAYPLGVVPTLSHMSIMTAQSSAVLVSFVAFSVNVSHRETYQPFFKCNVLLCQCFKK